MNTMTRDDNKTIIMNIVTGIIVLGFVGAAYFVFFKKDEVVTEVASTEEVAFETVVIHSEVLRTQQELKMLKEAVSRSKEFFANTAFRDLVDRSVGVSAEAIRREDPFVVPKWKTDLERAGQSASLPMPPSYSEIYGL